MWHPITKLKYLSRKFSLIGNLLLSTMSDKAGAGGAPSIRVVGESGNGVFSKDVPGKDVASAPTISHFAKSSSRLSSSDMCEI